MDTSNKKIVISTHYLVYGAPQAMRDYLIKTKFPYVLYIAHPLFVDGMKSYFEKITKGKILSKYTSSVRSNNSLVNYFIETILTLMWVLRSKEKYELFVGVDSLNASVGIFLKKLGRVNKVVFYTIDYVPVRFKNKFLNNIYHLIDKFCVTHADETWNVSPRIEEGREQLKGLTRKVYKKQKVVPIGIWYDNIKRLPFNKIKKNQLFFIGHLMESAGVQLVFKAIPELIKTIPNFHFLVVGGGEYEETLRQMIKDLKLEKYVTMTGWIKDRKKLDTIMQDSAIAIAMYDKRTSRNTYYADPTKLKDYLSAGLPIILTDLPHNAYDIAYHKCGIVVKYDQNEITRAILTFMKDSKKLQQYRTNALKYAQLYDWNTIFENHLLPLLK